MNQKLMNKNCSKIRIKEFKQMKMKSKKNNRILTNQMMTSLKKCD